MNNEQIWEAYREIGVTERHFNDLQSKYRLLVSSWLLATFLGIGFVITTNITISVGIYEIISLISLLGSLGILLLWNLDIMVYHRLLDAAFIQGVELENNNNWLPKFRTNAIKSQKGKGVLYRIKFFYFGVIFILQCISLFSLFLSISISFDWKKIIYMTIILIFITISSILVLKKSENKELKTIVKK